MARVVILGAGVAGHTAALHAKRILGKTNEIIVISPNSKYNWIPSNIWVGVGKMSAEQVSFPLAPIYEKQGIEFHQALAQSIHPQGDSQIQRGYVQVSYTSPEHNGEIRAAQNSTLRQLLASVQMDIQFQFVLLDMRLKQPSR
jgi:sulfide:quinone oxidoreductase